VSAYYLLRSNLTCTYFVCAVSDIHGDHPHQVSAGYEPCCVVQYQKECVLGVAERRDMDKTGYRYYALGDWALPNQHVDNIWKFDTKHSDIQALGAVLARYSC